MLNTRNNDYESIVSEMQLVHIQKLMMDLEQNASVSDYKANRSWLHTILQVKIIT